MKKSFMFLWLGTVLGCTFFSLFLMNTLAKEPPRQEMVSYYTCIQIQPGDTLWSIAEVYAKEAGVSVDEYVSRLKQMNHMGEDTLHTGCYLTIMYQKPARSEEEQNITLPAP